MFGAPFVLPVLDQEDESDAGTALAPQTFSKSADSPPREEPSSRYLDLIVNFDRRTVSRSGEKYALIKPVSFSGDANWPLFCALFDKSGDALTKVEMNRLPGKGGAARRVLKMRLNEALFPLDVTIPDGEWKLIEAPRRNAKVARKQT